MGLGRGSQKNLFSKRSKNNKGFRTPHKKLQNNLVFYPAHTWSNHITTCRVWQVKKYTIYLRISLLHPREIHRAEFTLFFSIYNHLSISLLLPPLLPLRIFLPIPLSLLSKWPWMNDLLFLLPCDPAWPDPWGGANSRGAARRSRWTLWWRDNTQVHYGLLKHVFLPCFSFKMNMEVQNIYDHLFYFQKCLFNFFLFAFVFLFSLFLSTSRGIHLYIYIVRDWFSF